MILEIGSKRVPYNNVSYWERDSSGLKLYINNGHKLVVQSVEEQDDVIMKLKNYYATTDKVSF